MRVAGWPKSPKKRLPPSISLWHHLVDWVTPNLMLVPNSDTLVRIAVISILFCSLLASAVHAETKPNIIFFLVDDLGQRDIGCYGSEFHETPAIDQLAKDGMLFTNAYATCHVCSPSRASILTGKYPGGPI